MGEAKRRKMTHADVELHISQAVAQVKLALSQRDVDAANIAGRIYNQIYGGYERALLEEKRLMSNPRKVMEALESVLLTTIAAITEDMIIPEKRVVFVEALTKRLGMKLSDFVQGKMPQGMKILDLDNSKAN
jgi:hypothetical protein